MKASGESQPRKEESALHFVRRSGMPRRFDKPMCAADFETAAIHDI